MNSQQACQLFRLPPELRNIIYSLSFAASDVKQHVNLLEARHPSSALLMSCQLIRKEAQGLYRLACAGYWSNTAFKLDLDSISASKPSTLPAILNNDNLQHIRHLQLTSMPAVLIDHPRAEQSVGYLGVHVQRRERTAPLVFERLARGIDDARGYAGDMVKDMDEIEKQFNVRFRIEMAVSTKDNGIKLVFMDVRKLGDATFEPVTREEIRLLVGV